ncbi:MAG: SDR family oxidoreductase [Georgfuchsia sp.]
MDATAFPLPETLPDLSGKVALVTGTTSGLGARFAWILANAGATVALTGRRVDRLRALYDKILAAGGKAATFALDVTDPNDIRKVVHEVEMELGAINILVNNAGIGIQAQAVDLSQNDFDMTLKTNVAGAFFAAQEVGRRMIKRKSGGQIVNIASTGAHNAMPGFIAYCMSKAALVMMTKALAKEWAPYGINVNAISPGSVRTEINSDWLSTELGKAMIDSFPRHRVGEVEDVDEMLLMLCSGKCRIMTGTEIILDDAQTL